MNLEELSERELRLISEVNSIQGTIESKIDHIEKLGIFDKYIEIHNEYSELSGENIEALKRGLFIMWYSATEPHFLTGIADVTKDSINRIMKSLNDRILAHQTDFELDWMLSYYSSWEFAIDVSKFPIIEEKLKKNIELPEKIERGLMENRGQMGIYWNSLN